MNKIIDVAYVGVVTYLFYCAVDRLCIKSEKVGFDRGFEAGRALGHIDGMLDIIKHDKKLNEESES